MSLGFRVRQCPRNGKPSAAYRCLIVLSRQRRYQRAYLQHIKTLNKSSIRSGKKGIVHMFDEPSSYQIRLRGHLSPQWETYFDGFTLTNSENGEALLTGVIMD